MILIQPGIKGKFIFLLSVLLISTLHSVTAQSKVEVDIPKYYSELLSYSTGKDLHPLEILQLTRKASAIDHQHVSYAEFVEIDLGFGSDLRGAVPNGIQTTLSFKNEIYPIVLKRRHLKTANYQLSTSGTRSKQDVDSYFYNGVIEGEYESWVTLSIIDGVARFLLASADGNIEVSQSTNGSYAIYKSSDLVSVQNYECHNTDDSKELVSAKSSSRSVGSDCVELYLECDHQSYLDNGSSVAATEAWALSMLNDVATIYNSINVPIVINNVFVWNTPDPYIQSESLQAVRDSFVVGVADGYDARIAQLLSTRDLGGGLAYGVGGLCGSSSDFPAPYSIATSLETNYSSYPNYSFTVNVLAHELGHVFGARHTHACVWGLDFDSQIDDCGNVYASSNNNQTEGQECFDENNPILPANGGGTIMSFCNLSGGGIDLANGFGSEVGDLIFDKYITAPCATGNLCASIPPANDDCINAIELPENGVCNALTFDNVLATASGVADPSCGDVGSSLDVWFSFVPSSASVGVEFKPVNNQVEDVVVTIYSGSCGSLTEIYCEEVINDKLFIDLLGLSINQNYYIRIIESGSDEFGAFELCVTNSDVPCHPAYNALIELYNNTDGDNWTVNTGWSIGATGANCKPCEWYGITCDNLNNVIGIDLFNNNLNGVIPNSLSEVRTLRTLKLMNNNLSGDFPDIWSTLDVLEFIDLSNNVFTGNMPASLGTIQKLNTLYIENNNMDGPLLPSIADLPLLNVYWTKNNNFSGCYPESYIELCEISSVKFTNNPLLPNQGNAFDEFCALGYGSDTDSDGFCFGIGAGDDCVDDDDTIYPGAPELCDGKDNNCNGDFDEGSVTENIWTANGGGDWNNFNNWSLGVVPAPCHDVVFPFSASNRMITISGVSDGFARSITIFENNTLINSGSVMISGSDDYGMDVRLGSSFVNTGSTDIQAVSTYGIYTNGEIENTGDIIIENLGTDFELYISLGAYFINNGSIVIR
jgi:hypothetical protein